MSEKTFEALWDCEGCGTKGHLAKTHRECPSCGRGQSGKRYAPPRNQRVAAVSEGRGPDWACLHCTTYNPAMEKHCRSCSAPKGSATSVPITPPQPSVPRAPKLEPKLAPKPEPAPTRAPPPQPAPKRPPPVVQEDLFREERRHPTPAWTPPVRRRAPVVGGTMSNSIWSHPATYIIPISVLALAGIITCAVWKKDVEAEVQGHTWDRRVLVETLTPQHDSAWCSELPHGAVMVGTPVRAVHHHAKRKVGESCETVAAHYEPAPHCDKTPVCTAVSPESCHVVDNGDGTMTEKCPEPKCSTPKCPEGKQVAASRVCTDNFVDEPIYNTKCTYSINRWVSKDTWEVANGADLNPFWPNVAMVPCGSPEQVGCQRIAKREETYVVRLRDEDGQSFPCTYHEQHWRTFPIGSKWMTVENFAGTPDCSKMKAL